VPLGTLSMGDASAGSMKPGKAAFTRWRLISYVGTPQRNSEQSSDLKTRASAFVPLAEAG
jgi:hypothetical protein